MTKFSMKTGNQLPTPNPSEGEVKRYKMCYVDADTFVVRCAKMMQEDYIEVKHLPTGRIKEFRNKTEFGVRSGKIIEGGWIYQQNENRKGKGLTEFPLEDFVIEVKARLNPDFEDVEDAMKTAEMVFASNVKGIKGNMESEDYMLLISSGNGNYRDKESKTIIYKSKRGEKPIFFQDFKDKIASTYKNKIWWTDNNEAEDYIQYIAKQQEALYGEDRSLWDSCAAWVDKDVNQCFIFHKCYDKYDQGWIEYDKFYCEKTLVAQTIAGDPTDTIEGLPSLPESVTKYFKLRKSNGVSKTTAEKLLDGCKTKQELWERAVFCYQQYYGMAEQYKFKDVHGDDQSWNWMDYMQQCYSLVKMQEYKGQTPCLRTYLGNIGVDWKGEVRYGELVVDTENLTENLNACKDTLSEVEHELKSYKSLKKDDLVGKLDNTAKLFEKLKGNLSLLEGTNNA